MNVYLRRVAKYLVYMFFMALAIVMLMNYFGHRPLDSQLSERSLPLMIMIVVLAFVYPKIGFVKREVKLNMDSDRELLDKAFLASDYKIENSSANVLKFRAVTTLKRFVNMWEDEITVERDDNYVVISGIRKEVVKIEYRIKSFR